MVMRMYKIGFLVICILIIVGVATAATAYLVVMYSSSPKQYSDVSKIPYNRVALVLGTNPLAPSGNMNYYFKYRIDACERLYKAGKVSKILVSGDNHSKDYDEPSCMKQALMERGIPESDIILDYAGFRTLDSVVRCKKVFGQERVTIISQGYHNARAIYLATSSGIDAIGYDAKDIKRTRTYYIYGVGREALARVKMFVDLVLDKQPKFLGEMIEI